jgi:HK97 family phage prohead protease
MPPTNTLARETKTLAFQIKATGVTTSDDGQEFGQIECYGAIFDNIDDGNDRINKGAFMRTIQNSKSRAKARQKKYVLPILWQHDTNELIGGWYDLKEDDTGLLCKGEVALATQRGREYYALAKAGMSDQFSIIYDIPTGGARYDKSGVRDLTEIRLFSIDAVTFAMNDETYLVGVKSMDLEYKTACGSTSGTIGPRDESWDGAAAKKWIWGKALDEEGKVKASVAKKYFMRCDGDPSLKTSYGYPFWTNDHISVGGVKAVAGALAGARNADAGSDDAAMRGKVNTLYGRINSKYPDAEPLVPPWKDDGKMDIQPKQQKTFIEHYNEEMAEDLLEDLNEVWFASLCKAIVDAFKMGEEPETAISEALDAFKTQFMKDFVPRAIECDMCEYLATDDMDSPMNTMYRYYGYMSRRGTPARKAGRAISASNQSSIDNHVSSLHDMANKMLADMKAHTKAVHTAADDFANTMQGAEQPYDGDDPGTPDEGQQEGKAYELALAELKTLRTR